jgi:hypothetical protein
MDPSNHNGLVTMALLNAITVTRRVTVMDCPHKKKEREKPNIKDTLE